MLASLLATGLTRTNWLLSVVVVVLALVVEMASARIISSVVLDVKKAN